MNSKHFIPKARPQALSIQHWPLGTKPLVSIWCATHNHNAFLGQALDSFLMQETTFPVEIIIHDDASTDRTQEIIQFYQNKHPQVIVTMIQPTNILGSGVVSNLHSIFSEKSLGDYVAYCDGDDFWTDKAKLQTQVDVMESSPDVSLTYHQVHIAHGTSLNPSSDFFPQIIHTHPKTEELLATNFVPTCSVLLRSNAHHNLSETSSRIELGDWSSWIMASLKGRILGLPGIMSCYRQHAGGMWHGATPTKQRWVLYQFWVGMLEVVPERFHLQICDNILTIISKGAAKKDPQFRLTKRTLYLIKLTYLVFRNDPFQFTKWASELSKAWLGPEITQHLHAFSRIARKNIPT
jgi:glycosyltransferase involved in cell wall biosynthesis